MRRDLATVAKRVEKMRQHARRFILPPLPLTCTGEWADADARAYAEGDEATRDALESKYLGPLAPCLDPLGIRAIVVSVDPDWSNTEPDAEYLEESAKDAARVQQARQRHADLLAQLAAENERETLGYDPTAPDPRDPDPTGDPEAVLYISETTGYPVRRREHQELRARAREHLRREAADRAIIEQARANGSYVAYDPRRGQ